MLEPDDIDRIAESMVTKVKSTHHDFWIDPESHYQDHQKLHHLSDDELYDIKNLIKMFNTTRGLFFKAFIGFAIIGAIILTGIGFGGK